MLHSVKVREPSEKNLPYLDRIPKNPVIGWGVSLPTSKKPNQIVEYIINTVKLREIYGSDDEDEGALADD